MAPRSRIHPAWLLLIATWVLIGAYFVHQRGSAPPAARPEAERAAPRTEPPRPAPEAIAATRVGSPAPKPNAILQTMKAKAAAPLLERAPAATPTPASTGPQLRLRLLEATERRPIPRVSVWLHPSTAPEDRAAAVKGFTDGNGELVHVDMKPGKYRASAKAAMLPPTTVGTLEWRGDETGERVVELLWDGFATLRVEASTPDRDPAVGVKLSMGYDWLPPMARGVAMERKSLGYTLDLVTDGEGYAAGPFLTGFGAPPEIWTTDGSLISLDGARWGDSLPLSAYAGSDFPHEPLKLFVRTDTLRVSIRLLHPEPQPMGEGYLLSYEFYDRSGRGPISAWKVPVDRGFYQFAAPRGARGTIEINTGDWKRKEIRTNLTIRAVQLPDEGTDFEVLLDLEGNVSFVGKAITPSGKPAAGVAFLVSSNAAATGYGHRVQTKEVPPSAADGSFATTLFSAETFTLTIAPRRSLTDGQPYYLREPLTLSQKQIEAGPVEVTVVPSGAVWGTVLDPKGNPLGGATVGAIELTNLKRAEMNATTDMDGVFTLDLPQLDEGLRVLICAFSQDGTLGGFAPAEISTGDKVVVNTVGRASFKLTTAKDAADDLALSIQVPGLDRVLAIPPSARSAFFLGVAAMDENADLFSGGSPVAMGTDPSPEMFQGSDAPANSGKEWLVWGIPIGLNAAVQFNGHSYTVLPDPAATDPTSHVLVETNPFSP